MDLSQLTQWSRDKLEREARRIGVWAPHRKDNAELIRRIRAHHDTPVRRVSRLFRRAAKLARSLTAPRLEAPQSTSPTFNEAATSPTTSVATSGPVAAASVAVASATSSAPKSRKPDHAKAKIVTVTDAEVVSEPPPLTDEPMPTRTMARLLGSQGHAKRALMIYRRLIHKNPGDASLVEEADALRGSSRSRRTRKKSSATAESDDEHGVVFARVSDQKVLVAWSLRDPSLALAELGPRSRPALRVIVVRPTAEGGIVRETMDFPGTFEGERILFAPKGARLTGAIGVITGSRFSSLVHSEPDQI